MLKSLIVKLLIFRLRKSIKSNAHKVIFVIGGAHRPAYRDALYEALKKKGVHVRVNKPGYNYILGTLLTLTKQKAGGHSLLQWIHIVFNSAITLDDIVIQEFVYQGTQQEKEFIGLIRPLGVILTHDHDQNLSLENMTICRLQEKDIYLCSENNESQFPMELISYVETEQGSECVYRYKEEEYTFHLTSYGIHYAYAYMLAHALHDIYVTQQEKRV